MSYPTLFCLSLDGRNTLHTKMMMQTLDMDMLYQVKKKPKSSNNKIRMSPR
jgi:transposase